MATYSDIFIDQGSSYSSTVVVQGANGLPLNLTGYTARGQIRKSYKSLNAINFVTNINAPNTGTVNISLTSTQTRAMAAGRYVYDIEVYNSSNNVIRVSEGQVEISPATTQP
jgi:hypothetical protein